MIKLIKSAFYHEADVRKKVSEFMLQDAMLSMNSECKKFEDSFAKAHKRKYAVFVHSGSAANLLLTQAFLNLGIWQKGDRIGFSALTWPTNVMPFIQLGLEPVPIDCELRTLNVSPQKLALHIKYIKGFFLTNVLGLCDDIRAVRELCREEDVVFLEDNCEGLGTEVKGTLSGSFGFASTFSFFVGHHLSTIEGGMICTDDTTLYRMLVMIRAHGWDRNLTTEEQERIRAEHGIDAFYGKYTFYDLAYNVRPTEINGLIGNMLLPYLDEIAEKRFENFRIFDRAIKNNPDFLPFETSHIDRVSNFAMPVICRSQDLRDKYRKKFDDHQVETRPVIAGDMTRQPFYKKYVREHINCVNSSIVHTNGFYFPNNPELTADELDLLTSLLARS